ncbi:heparinase II/III-family protein [Pigmentiphaga sp. NML030171]|uniref:heparinase II/III family protein n=1 Tax=Pigmentiphaga sp. NML030171 TaxID=2008676 RepID=UPI0020CF3D42|nr:heparinase II/III-family protein [Pigmentiphaga sp. NML030171]
MIGDIKIIWEASRFGWVLAFATEASRGNSQSIARLNDWLENWCKENPPYIGPNWKCGQEASIRVIHLATASLIMGTVQTPTFGFLELLSTHLQRIEPTLPYAIAQDNNHGTSEAAALFIGGSYLEHHGILEGRRWSKLGRKWLENRAKRLILPDGTFSQYSTNYHRLMLDTFSISEIFRQKFQLAPFSQALFQRICAAIEWLTQITDPQSGDAWNWGANDGAHILHLTQTGYRDFRPSLQLAGAIFLERRIFDSAGEYDIQLDWLNIPRRQLPLPPLKSKLLPNGGIAILRRGEKRVFLRFPSFEFRPSHADSLHLDFWIGNKNFFRDAGTFSYNASPTLMTYFSGVQSHNTIQFDDRDQMPRLGRFLFGGWPRIDQPIKFVDDSQTSSSVTASYTDYWGAYHQRQVILTDHNLSVIDNISDFERKAVLRWRLPDGIYSLNEKRIYTHYGTLEFTSSSPNIKIRIVNNWESIRYLEKKESTVVELEVQEPCQITTTFNWPG